MENTELELSGSEDSGSQLEPIKQRKKLTGQLQRLSDQSQATISRLGLSKEEEHVPCSGKSVRAKEMGPGCKENCRYKCHSRLTFEERLGIYNNFYQTAPTLKQQWEYICQTVTKTPKKDSTRDESRRANTYCYSFRIKGEDRRVCKTMYLSTLQISNSIVETAFHKRRANGTMSPCKRGRARLSSNSSKENPQDLTDPVSGEDSINSLQNLTHRSYVLWMLMKQAEANSQTDDLPLSVRWENSHDMSSEDCSASGSEVRAETRLGDPAVIEDATDNTPLNVVSTEMDLSGSEESDSESERKRQRRSGQSKDITSKEKERVARSGKPIRAKEMGPGCKESCRYNCHSRVTHEERVGIYTDFYRKAPTLEKQWEYICKTVKKGPKKDATRDESRRANTYSYSFCIKGEERKVCKTMYLSTLQISNSIVETAFHKRRANGTISPSKRGKAPLSRNSARRIPQDLKDSVRDHINMFPRVPPHCCGKKTTEECLQEGMSVARMHRMYVLWMLKRRDASRLPTDVPKSSEEGNNSQEVSCDISANDSDVQSQFRSVDPSLIDGKVIATERQYRDMFDNDFNLSFYSSKRNKCDECVVLMRTPKEEEYK